MEITEVRVKLMEDSDDRLQGFCSITFDDCFVVRDLKIIEGANGPFVAMPSRKLTTHCSKCGCKNHLRSAYCNHCGGRLKDDSRDHDGRSKLYADIAHPINSDCREQIQNHVIAEYRSERERSSQPGYISKYDDYYEFEDTPDLAPAAIAPVPKAPAAKPPVATAPAANSSSPSISTTAARIEPAQPKPRGPHHPPSKQTEKSHNDDDSFGAGIL